MTLYGGENEGKEVGERAYAHKKLIGYFVLDESCYKLEKVSVDENGVTERVLHLRVIHKPPLGAYEHQFPVPSSPRLLESTGVWGRGMHVDVLGFWEVRKLASALVLDQVVL